VATDTARTTEKSYWGRSREWETKQVQFKTLFKYSQRWGRGDVQWQRVPDAGSGYRKSARADGGQLNSRNNQVVRSRGPESATRRQHGWIAAADTVVRRRSEHGTSGQQPCVLCAPAHVTTVNWLVHRWCGRSCEFGLLDQRSTF